MKGARMSSLTQTSGASPVPAALRETGRAVAAFSALAFLPILALGGVAMDYWRAMRLGDTLAETRTNCGHATMVMETAFMKFVGIMAMRVSLTACAGHGERLIEVTLLPGAAVEGPLGAPATASPSVGPGVPLFRPGAVQQAIAPRRHAAPVEVTGSLSPSRAGES